MRIVKDFVTHTGKLETVNVQKWMNEEQARNLLLAWCEDDNGELLDENSYRRSDGSVFRIVQD